MSKIRVAVPVKIVGTLVAAAMLSACGGATSDSPQTTGNTSSATSSDGLPKNGAPAVASPVDATKFASTSGICSTLSKQALAGLRVSGDGTGEDSFVGPSCAWPVTRASEAAPGDLQQVEVTANTKLSHEGLSDVYRNRAQAKVFQPLGEIDGLPATISVNAAVFAQNQCSVMVGVSNNLVFSVGATLHPGAGDPCAAAKRVAPLFVQTVKGG